LRLNDEASAASGPGQPVGWLDRIVDLLLGATLLVAVVAIFTQVILRYVFSQPSSWLDEFAVLVFAWMIFIGAAVAQRTDSHVAMNVIVKLLPLSAQRVLCLLRSAAMAAVLAILFWQGLQLTLRLGSVEYPAMGISRGFLFATLPATAPLFLLYLGRTLWRRRRAIGRAPGRPGSGGSP
jgi:TRAP-type C4-dicarboxylate transport system permease small subunit